MLLTRLQNESAEYVAARERLRIAEIELMRQREAVAALRRSLPAGAVVQDYTFVEGPRDLDAGDEPVREVRLSELSTGPGRSRMADDIGQRGIDLLSPVWNLMDLTPEGRGDWNAELAYPEREATPRAAR
jgi:predicted dithiol-disulfide oxidoreductase (DUF899 family)